MFPYFYVPYGDDLPADPAAAHTYLRDLAQGIEIAMRANSQVSPDAESCSPTAPWPLNRIAGACHCEGCSKAVRGCRSCTAGFWERSMPIWQQHRPEIDAGSCFMDCSGRHLVLVRDSGFAAIVAQGRKRQCVFGAQLVRARRFYGYADGESMFIKITVYNPRDVSKVADLLRVRVGGTPSPGMPEI